MSESFKLHPASKDHSYNRLTPEEEKGWLRRSIPYGPGLFGLFCFSLAAHAKSAGIAIAVGIAVLGVTSAVLGYYQEKYESKFENREFSVTKALTKGAIGFGYGAVGHYSPDKNKDFKTKTALRALHFGLAVVTMGLLPVAKMCDRIYTYSSAIKDLEKQNPSKPVLDQERETLAREKRMSESSDRDPNNHYSSKYRKTNEDMRSQQNNIYANSRAM